MLTSSAYIKKSISQQKNVINKINTTLFYIFLFNVIFIPNDTFGLKIISLAILLTLNIKCIFSPRTNDEKAVFIFGFILTSFTIVWSTFLTKELIANFKAGYPGYILLLYSVIKKYRIDLYKILIEILHLLALFSIGMAFLDISGILDMYDNAILNWFQQSSNAMIGKGAHLPIYYMLFFKTTPLLFVALLHDLSYKKAFYGIISFCALLLSGTRANIFMLFAVVCLYLCFMQKNQVLKLLSFTVVCVSVFLIVCDGRVINFVIDMFQRKSGGDATRAGHLQGILEVWKNNPVSFFIGSGYSAKFYSYGISQCTSNVELSYWNLLRQDGLILFVFTMIMYFYPIFKLIRQRRNYEMILAYVAYLIIAYTNPFLYSSTGLSMVLLMYYICNKKSGFLLFEKKRKFVCEYAKRYPLKRLYYAI